MDTQLLHKGSDILLAVGIALLILTIILSFRFRIYETLISEFGKEKNRAANESNDYFARAESSKSRVIEELNSFPDAAAVVADSIISEAAPKADKKPAAPAATVVKPKKKASRISETVVASRKKRPAAEESDYRITENIIIIHGDPHAVK